MADFSVEFWTLAEETGWGQSALISTLLNNVCDELKRELMMRDVPKTLSDVITLCVKLDEHLRARRGIGNYISQRPPGRMETSGGGAPSGSHSLDSTEESEQPMQLGRSSLSPEERYRRWRAGECYYCGRKGHIAMDCQARLKDSARR